MYIVTSESDTDRWQVWRVTDRSEHLDCVVRIIVRCSNYINKAITVSRVELE